MRCCGVTDPNAASQQNGHLESAAAHVLDFGNLIHDFANRVEHEIGKHEINHGARSRHACPASQPDKSPLANRCIAQSCGTINVVKSRRGLKVTSPDANPFSHYEDIRIFCHLFGEGFVSGLGHRDFATGGRGARILQRGLRRGGTFGIGVLSRSLGVGQWASFRKGPGLFDHRLDFGVDRIELGGRHDLLLNRFRSQTLDGTSLFPFLHVFTRPISKVTHPLCVSPRPISHTFDQSRTAIGSSPDDSFTCHAVQFERVVPVDRQPRHAVGDTATPHAGVSSRIGEGHFRCKLVVFTNEQNGKFPDARHVEPLVEGSVIHGTVSKKGDGDMVGLHQFEAVSTSTGLQNARADDPTCPHHSHFGREQMHAPPAAS